MSNALRPRDRFGIPEPQPKRGWLMPAIFTLFSLLFVTGGVASGYVFVTRASALVQATLLQSKDGASKPNSDLVKPSPAAPSSGESAAGGGALIGADRINILLLGIDQRSGEQGQPTRSDTIIVVSLDPVGKTAAMLSIPRDLWVPIPLNDKKPIEAKITTAHFYGDYYHFPGGGPALAKKAVQYNLGIRINYYARVNFEGFRRIVDTLGGIDVEVPKTLVDNEYPTDDYGFQRVYIPAGCQHLNGDLALKYARSRHMDSDIGRMKRQQAVLLAIRKRALSLNVIPKLPQLALQLADTVDTDIPIPQLLKIAQLGKDIDASRITALAIEGSAVRDITTANGEEALLPVRPEIHKIVTEVFAPPAMAEQQSSAPRSEAAGSQPLAAPAAPPPASAQQVAQTTCG